MTLALATRGYLCRCRSVHVGAGPIIASATQPVPEVDAATVEPEKEGPQIRGGKKRAPLVRGATAEPTLSPKAPAGKGKKVAPTIRKAKKE